MARRGGNKHSCDKYKASGHLQENKRKKQEREAKRVARFAKRKEEGKSYKYKANPYKEGTSEYYEEQQIRAEKNYPYKNTNSYSKKVSIFRRLTDELNRQKLAQKQEESLQKKKTR